ncbi:DNA-binding transcriptional MerR regulator [Branchiibius hedensis]|uniref:DNA-binding transcriptional regulator, MerR family n=1 Tax=Branchiibius hedensis TaxID=672460 RepID=A0A2Y8ZZH0_9MICO|nr:helix-turn-helix domain-containing protein [Branchiibius hedensis]PWJ26495.1 DNA-binding transcriptional MerR regulator [Branchiibius hedensis]SSA35307.1 DNA-binding transcriptional regulator, MerR family [Branchiibius hedensis]
MLSIGEFARVAGVSVRMLRHYDQLGLLHPASVDPSSGYRSYSASQFDRVNRLVALKELGFSLATVRELLDTTDEATLGDRLRLRRDQLRDQIEADGVRLRQIEARLRMIEKENAMSDYVLTSLAQVTLAQVSDTVSGRSEIGDRIGPLFELVTAAVDSAGVPIAGPALATYTVHGDEMEIAAAVPIPDGSAPAGTSAVTLTAVPSAVTTRFESEVIDDIVGAWQDLVREVEARGLTPNGVCREVYLETPQSGSGRWVVDLQQPVA